MEVDDLVQRFRGVAFDAVSQALISYSDAHPEITEQHWQYWLPFNVREAIGVAVSEAIALSVHEELARTLEEVDGIGMGIVGAVRQLVQQRDTTFAKLQSLSRAYDESRMEALALRAELKRVQGVRIQSVVPADDSAGITWPQRDEGER